MGSALRRLLDRVGKRDPLGASQDRQQQLNALVGPHAGVQSDAPGERTAHDLYSIAGVEPRWPRLRAARLFGARGQPGTEGYAC